MITWSLRLLVSYYIIKFQIQFVFQCLCGFSVSSSDSTSWWSHLLLHYLIFSHWESTNKTVLEVFWIAMDTNIQPQIAWFSSPGSPSCWLSIPPTIVHNLELSELCFLHELWWNCTSNYKIFQVVTTWLTLEFMGQEPQSPFFRCNSQAAFESTNGSAGGLPRHNGRTNGHLVFLRPVQWGLNHWGWYSTGT